MEQIEQITKMEGYLDEATNAIKELSNALGRYEQCLEKIEEVSNYYGSEEWFRDLNDYDGGKWPKDLKCGVLSEDLVYDMYADNRELAIRMLELGTQIIKRC